MCLIHFYTFTLLKKVWQKYTFMRSKSKVWQKYTFMRSKFKVWQK